MYDHIDPYDEYLKSYDKSYFLSKGSHPTPDAGRCAMEWVAFIAGEEHSDRPVCVSPVLQSFCVSFNDALDDERRQRLRPYLARCIGTAGDGLDEQRAWMATDWLLRRFVPAWLDAGGLHAHAQNLRSFGRAVTDVSALAEIQGPLNEARKAGAAAWAAAGDAARDAARDAAWAAARAAGWDWDAAWDAAWAAAWAAARAAGWDAAWDAGWDAAWDAARAAAGDAARDAAWAAAGDAARDAGWAAQTYEAVYAAALQKLTPISDGLIEEAFGLLDRMLPTEIIQVPALPEVAEELTMCERVA